MRGRIFAHQNLISEMSILSPLRVSAFLHSQDPKRTLGRLKKHLRIHVLSSFDCLGSHLSETRNEACTYEIAVDF
jgi:hypothetical protein